MWIADQWKDYEVIDTSNGEKLERWGEYLLVRPDPQVIWNTPHQNPGWKQKNGHYHRSSKGGGEWEFIHLPNEWTIHYKELTFHLKPFRTVPGAGSELGLVLRTDSQRGAPGQSTEPIRIHRRCHPCCRQGRCFRYSCGCLQRNGFLGQGERCIFWSRRRPYPLACG